MPAKNLNYRIHQEFYDDFSIFHVKGVKSHGCFTYKIYKGKKRALLPVLSSDKNIKWVDHNFFTQISEKIEKNTTPCLSALIKKVRHFQNIVKKLSFEDLQGKQATTELLNKLELLQSILFDYRHDIQQKLLVIFQKPFKDNEGCHFYPVTGEEIKKLIQSMTSLQFDFKNCIEFIKSNHHHLQGGGKDATSWAGMDASMPAFLAGCKQLLQSYEIINCWCRTWLPVRILHEKQEILN